MRKVAVVTLALAALLFGAQAFVANAVVFGSSTARAEAINAPSLQETATADADTDVTATTAATAAADEDATTAADEDATTTAPGNLPNTGAGSTSAPLLIVLSVVLLAIGLGILALLTFRRRAQL